MQLFPQHTLGMLNLWWYPLIYGLVTILVMKIISKEKKKKILTFPKTKKEGKKYMFSFASFILNKILVIYSLLIPLKLFSINFYIGTFIYLIGLISSVYAIITFSKADLNEPVTHGIYNISRYPSNELCLMDRDWFSVWYMDCDNMHPFIYSLFSPITKGTRAVLP